MCKKDKLHYGCIKNDIDDLQEFTYHIYLKFNFELLRQVDVINTLRTTCMMHWDDTCAGYDWKYIGRAADRELGQIGTCSNSAR